MIETVKTVAAAVIGRMTRGGKEHARTIEIVISHVDDWHKTAVIYRDFEDYPQTDSSTQSVLVTACAADWQASLKIADERMRHWHHDLHGSEAFLECLCRVEEQAWAGTCPDDPYAA